MYRVVHKKKLVGNSLSTFFIDHSVHTCDRKFFKQYKNKLTIKIILFVFQILNYFDYFFTSVFTLEITIKVSFFLRQPITEQHSTYQPIRVLTIGFYHPLSGDWFFIRMLLSDWSFSSLAQFSPSRLYNFDFVLILSFSLLILYQVYVQKNCAYIFFQIFSNVHGFFTTGFFLNIYNGNFFTNLNFKNITIKTKKRF